jgi:hypothetical protein
MSSRDGTSLIFREQELLEFSICNVPANPCALAKAMTDTKQDTSHFNFWNGFMNSVKGE